MLRGCGPAFISTLTLSYAAPVGWSLAAAPRGGGSEAALRREHGGYGAQPRSLTRGLPATWGKGLCTWGPVVQGSHLMMGGVERRKEAGAWVSTCGLDWKGTWHWRWSTWLEKNPEREGSGYGVPSGQPWTLGAWACPSA